MTDYDLYVLPAIAFLATYLASYSIGLPWILAGKPTPGFVWRKNKLPKWAKKWEAEHSEIPPDLRDTIDRCKANDQSR